MKTTIKIVVCILFAGSVWACNRYEEYNNQRRSFYLEQERDIDLTGWWMYDTNEYAINYREYSSDGKIYRHSKNTTTNIVTTSKLADAYWYTYKEHIYTLEIYYGLEPDYRKMFEWEERYYFSEAKDILYIENPTGTYREYIRAERPE